MSVPVKASAEADSTEELQAILEGRIPTPPGYRFPPLIIEAGRRLLRSVLEDMRKERAGQ